MLAFDPIPGRHPRLLAWVRAFLAAGYSLGRTAQLFNIDAADLREAGLS